MKKIKSFVVSLIICIALALTSFSASADTYTFSGHSFRVYKTTTTGRIIGDQVTVYKTYKLIIDPDNESIYLNVDDTNYVFHIVSQEAHKDNFKGVYFYCSGGLTVNLYRDYNDKGHIIISTDTIISIYDI